MLVAEVTVTETVGGKHIGRIRFVLTNTVFLAGVVLLAMWMLLLGATLLPSGPALVVLLLIVSSLTVLLWRFFVQIHSRGQVALRDVFLETAPPSPPAAGEALQSILKDARLERVTLNAECFAAKKLIREMALRTRTGASIVGIERNGGSVINPGPDEEMLPGDVLILLGTESQLKSAREVLTGAS
jgi:CPA2 family monovalent cation:H+ antiporter-2